jgi:hypothetical protein
VAGGSIEYLEVSTYSRRRRILREKVPFVAAQGIDAEFRRFAGGKFSELEQKAQFSGVSRWNVSQSICRLGKTLLYYRNPGFLGMRLLAVATAV